MLTEKDAIISFLLKQKNGPHTSSVNEKVEKTVTETVDKIETEKAKFRLTPNKKKENQTKQTEKNKNKKKKKVIVTGDSMVNGISEKGLNFNHKVKIVRTFQVVQMKKFQRNWII